MTSVNNTYGDNRNYQELAEQVDAIVKLAEKRSSLPIELLPESQFETPLISDAMVRIATDRIRIIYRDCLAFEDRVLAIAHECGHVIRLFMAEPEKRLRPQPIGMEILAVAHEPYIAFIKNHMNGLSENDLEVLHKNFREKEVAWGEEWSTAAQRQILKEYPEFVELAKTEVKAIICGWEWLSTQFYGMYLRLIQVLASVPQDMSIEKWLYKSYPVLREGQLARLNRALVKQTRNLGKFEDQEDSDQLQLMYHAMNYAFHDLVGECIGTDLCNPYAEHKMVLDTGGQLASAARAQKREDHEGDISTISLWAKILGIEKWISWEVLS